MVTVYIQKPSHGNSYLLEFRECIFDAKFEPWQIKNQPAELLVKCVKSFADFIAVGYSIREIWRNLYSSPKERPSNPRNQNWEVQP